MMRASLHQGGSEAAGPDGGPLDGRAQRAVRRPVPVAPLAVAVLTVAALAAVLPAAAQQTGYYGGSVNPNVYVNTDLLNSLGPAGPAPALPYAGGYGQPAVGAYPYGMAAPGAGQGSFFLNRPGTLLFPPAAYPRSVLVNRGASGQPQLQAPSRQQAAAPVLTPPSAAPKSPAAPSDSGRSAAAAPKQTVAPPPPVPAEPTKASVPEPKASPAPATMAEAPAPPAPPAAAAAAPAAAVRPDDKVAMPPVPPPLPPADEGTQTADAGATKAAPEPVLTPPPPPGSADSGSEAAGQSAAVPPADAPAPGATGDEMSLAFSAGSAELSDEVKSELRQLAKTLIQDGNARVQLLAYATSSEDSPSRARRLSLSRALAVRAYLIDQGVRSTRMDVRALGDKAPDSPKDRVDIEPARR